MKMTTSSQADRISGLGGQPKAEGGKDTMKIEEMLENLCVDFSGREKTEWERGDDKPILQCQQALLSAILSALPKEKSVRLGVDDYLQTPEPEGRLIVGYNSALSDVRTKLKEMFE